MGTKLVEELKLADSVDTLGRWMAHHIAELLHDASTATGEDQSAKHSRLRDAILAFWTHRFELPNGKRPFSEFEPILRALESLDPESEMSRYFRPSRAPESGSDESKESREWINLAHGLDHTSKVLIDYCLTLAAEAALDKSKEWVELAKEAGVDDSFEFRVIRFVSDQSDLLKQPDLNAHQRRVLTDRKAKLDAFLSMATLLSNDINVRLQALPPAVADPNEMLMSDLGKP